LGILEDEILVENRPGVFCPISQGGGVKRVFLGIPAFNGITPESAGDYIRFAYYLGRRYPEYDFYLGIVSKLEQFRARNEIVKAALSTGCDYLLMLDDDHVIDTADRAVPSAAYEFLRILIGHLEANPKIGLVGALYWQRGGPCHPVLMRLGEDGKYYWLTEEELEDGLQPVAVTGGGCMLFPCRVFDHLSEPWFVPETEKGTDFQIAEAVRRAGYEVWADTSIELGHVVQKREILTARNRPKHLEASVEFKGRIDQDWNISSMLLLYNGDVEEYLGLAPAQVKALAEQYGRKGVEFRDFADPREYYRSLGREQLARQYVFHNQPGYGSGQFLNALISLAQGRRLKILDYGCGSAPVGFEMLMQGHEVDFVDLDGAPAYEFTKWRVRRRKKTAGWSVGENYDVLLLLDVIEHLPEAAQVLAELTQRLNEGGYLVTNYFLLTDYSNPEHISMDKQRIRQVLLENQVYPKDPTLWHKQSL
jgi:hypothetical protein